MLQTKFPFFISKKQGEILIFGDFLTKKSILAYICTENQHFQVGRVLLRHCDIIC